MNQQTDNKPVLNAWITKETYESGAFDDVKLIQVQTKGKRVFKGKVVDLEELGYIFLEYTR